MELTETKKMVALRNFLCLCVGNQANSNTIMIYCILVLIALEEDNDARLFPYLDQSFIEELRKIRTGCFDKDKLYYELNLVKRKCISCLIKNKNSEPIKALQFDLASNRIKMGSYSDMFGRFYKGSFELGNDMRDIYYSFFDYCKLAKSRNKRYLLSQTSSKKYNDLESYIATLCSENQSNIFNADYKSEINAAPYVLLFHDAAITKDEFLNLYLSLIENEIRFWLIIVNDMYSSSPHFYDELLDTDSRVFDEYFISNVKVFKAGVDLARAEGDKNEAVGYCSQLFYVYNLLKSFRMGESLDFEVTPIIEELKQFLQEDCELSPEELSFIIKDV